MVDLRIAPRAGEDLVAIWGYSERLYGADAASSYLRGFNQLFDRFREFPELGASIQGIRPETRSFGYRQHRLFYRVGPSGIVVVRVLHKAQNARIFLDLI